MDAAEYKGPFQHAPHDLAVQRASYSIEFSDRRRVGVAGYARRVTSASVFGGDSLAESCARVLIGSSHTLIPNILLVVHSLFVYGYLESASP